MKQNYSSIVTKFYRSIILIAFLLIFAIPTKAYAIVYDDSWFSSTINECEEYAELTITMYYNRQGSPDDDLWDPNTFLQMRIGNGSFFDIAELTRDENKAVYEWHPNSDGYVGIQPQLNFVGSQLFTHGFQISFI